MEVEAETEAEKETVTDPGSADTVQKQAAHVTQPHISTGDAGLPGTGQARHPRIFFGSTVLSEALERPCLRFRAFENANFL